MFEWLTAAFKVGTGPPEIIQRSNEEHKSVTADEAEFMVYGLTNNAPACPDCERGVLLKGPEGCGSTNCMCNNCTSEFSIYWISHKQILADRISKPKKGDPERVKSIYGITR